MAKRAIAAPRPAKPPPRKASRPGGDGICADVTCRRDLAAPLRKAIFGRVNPRRFEDKPILSMLFASDQEAKETAVHIAVTMQLRIDRNYLRIYCASG